MLRSLRPYQQIHSIPGSACGLRSLSNTNALYCRAVIENIKKYKFDFDDSYQFTVAKKFDLTIVTFDKDFNAKGIKKKTPEEVIEKY